MRSQYHLPNDTDRRRGTLVHVHVGGSVVLVVLVVSTGESGTVVVIRRQQHRSGRLSAFLRNRRASRVFR